MLNVWSSITPYNMHFNGQKPYESYEEKFLINRSLWESGEFWNDKNNFMYRDHDRSEIIKLWITFLSYHVISLFIIFHQNFLTKYRYEIRLLYKMRSSIVMEIIIFNTIVINKSNWLIIDFLFSQLQEIVRRISIQTRTFIFLTLFLFMCIFKYIL